MAFRVIYLLSIPVWNAIVEGFGGISNRAPPADQIEFYTKFQLWCAVVLALLTAVGHSSGGKIGGKKRWRLLWSHHILFRVLISAAIIVLTKVFILAIYSSSLTCGDVPPLLAQFGVSYFRLAEASHVKTAGRVIGSYWLRHGIERISFKHRHSDVIGFNMSPDLFE